MSRRADFDRVFRRGRRQEGSLLGLRAAPNERALSRYAYSISKRVGNAVVRNRIRRRLREAVRALPLREGWDIVFLARPAAATSDFQSLKAEMRSLVERARLLPKDEA